MSRDWHGKVIVGKEFDFLPIIVQAKPILGIPKAKKRKNKSQFRIVQDSNKSRMAEPGIEPKLFIECEVTYALWGSSRTEVIDVETHKVYGITQGYATVDGKRQKRNYLKQLFRWSANINDDVKKPIMGQDFSNYQSVRNDVLGCVFTEDESS